MAKIGITGGAGFIGSHLGDALIAKGHEVCVIDKEEARMERRNAHIAYTQADIREPALQIWMAQERPEIVFHLAAYINDRADDVLLMHDHNVTGSLRVYEYAKQYGVKKIIFASSCAVYGIAKHMPVTEATLSAPLTPYGQSKFMGEQYLASYESAERSVTALRFANVYGPRQDGSKESGAIAVFIENLVKGSPFFLNGNGETGRDYIFIEDVIRALCLAGEKNVSGAMNIGTGRETSTKKLLEMIQKTAGIMTPPSVRPEVQDKVPNMVLESAKARSTLGWEPRTTLEEGIEKTIAWYREQKGKV